LTAALTIFPCLAQEPLSVVSFGAKCDWNGTKGSDDTSAFQSAVEKAGSTYASTGSTVTVQVPAGKSCVIAGKVTIGSGVEMTGPGTIIVPYQRGGSTLLFQNADNAGAHDLTLKVIAGPGGNDANLSVISWRDTAKDSSSHVNVAFRNNTVIDGSWGILVDSAFGSGSLRKVDISGNTVMSTTAYTNADGIHVNGNVHEITITHNKISNRHDAAIGLSSGPGASRTLSGAVVSDNTCLDDLVGLDNSGGTNAVWKNNLVRATVPASHVSNPAARSIAYVGITPVNIVFENNHLENYQGTATDFATKVDDTGVDSPTHVTWVQNTIVGTGAMWLVGNTIDVHDNIFSPGAVLNVGYVTPNYTYGRNISIGANQWLGSGTINAIGNLGPDRNNSLSKQKAKGKLTVNKKSNFRLQ
jgi:hypothetical protein